MNGTFESEPDHSLLDMYEELRWDAFVRTAWFIVILLAFLAVSGVWLDLSRGVMDGVCQTSAANTQDRLLEECQQRLELEGEYLAGAAEAIVPTVVAIGSLLIAFVLAAVLFLAPRIAGAARLFDAVEAPIAWITRALVALATLATAWAAVVAAEAIIELASAL